MSKIEVNRKIEKLSDNSLRATQTATVSDLAIPSPEEIEKYKEVDPRIVDLLIQYTTEEQKHRHYTENQKLKIVGNSERRVGRINIMGMLFAFLALLAMMCVTAYALYLDKQWLALILGGTSIATIVSIFIKPEKYGRK